MARCYFDEEMIRDLVTDGAASAHDHVAGVAVRLGYNSAHRYHSEIIVVTESATTMMMLTSLSQAVFF